MVRCCVCKEHKEASEFNKGPSRAGLQHRRRGCQAILAKTDAAKASRKLYYNSNKSKVRLQQYAYRELHGRKWDKEYKIRNKGKYASYERKRQATKINATPAWLTPEQNQLTQAFYIAARFLTKTTGVPHEVDHIVPLRGKEVRGLHVPWNLQILTEEANMLKRIRLVGV